MKATVSVFRTGYAQTDIEVDIPDGELSVQMSGGKRRKLTKKEIEKRLANAALAKAGGIEFSEHNADYEVEYVTLRPK